MSKLLKIINKIILYIMVIVSLIPFYIMLIGSLKQNSALMTIPPDILPFSFISDNYIQIFKLKFYMPFINSFILTFSITLTTVVVASCAGYVFAKKDFICKKTLFALLLATMMIPRQISMIPIFVLIINIGLQDNYLGLILSTAAAPFGVFLLKQFMQTLPNELLEAAKIDGSSELWILSRVVIPLSKPAISALAIFVFLSSWNDYIWQLVLISSRRKFTLPLALAGIMQEKNIFVGYQLAGAVIASVPMIAVFLAFQRYFIEGITLGAVKG